SNDKSFKIVRCISNVALLVATIAGMIAGIIMMATSFDKSFDVVEFIIGICLFLLSPVVIGLVWTFIDLKFTCIVDVKLIRNANYGYRDDKLLNNFAPFKFKGKKCKTTDKYENSLDKLVTYKKMVDEGILTAEEFVSIKNEIIGKEEKSTSCDKESFDTIIKLKKLCDSEVISKEEFATEKSKILSKK
ncbi:MAG: SHOCT domain-containing protein, partial [Clostridia bacterium]|nr:SHOCT domain-containing protein [Clostridia bacterium]